MGKNLVVCCDGTANEISKDLTNVVKLFSTLIQDPTRQVAYYHPGLGTMEAPGALTPIARRITRLLGTAFGYGLKADIQNAYLFLMANFEPGDHVFLFGFSRGAYTVRAVAALLHMYGLIRRGNETLVPYALRMLMAKQAAQKRRRGAATFAPAFDLADRFRGIFTTTTCKPHFVGLWDTVSSIGWYDNPLSLPFTAENPDVQISRHAIAIHERRAFFRTNLWMPKAPPADTGPKDLQQVWFTGAHSDIGGGYPERESGLSKITLEWMLSEAVVAGLLVDDAMAQRVLGRADVAYASPDPNGILHRSLTLAWWPAEFLWKRHYDWSRRQWRRRMNLGRRRTIPPNALIHHTAFDRADGSQAADFPPTAVKVTGPGLAHPSSARQP